MKNKELSNSEKLKNRLLADYFSYRAHPERDLCINRDIISRLKEKEIGIRLDGLSILIYNKVSTSAKYNIHIAFSEQGAKIIEIKSLDDILKSVPTDVLVVDSSHKNPTEETLDWIRKYKKEIMQIPLRILIYDIVPYPKPNENYCPMELKKYFHISHGCIQSYENLLRAPEVREIVGYWKNKKLGNNKM